MRAEATAHYQDHPMGYACRHCGASALVGDPVRHSGRCDVAPKRAVWPAWPTGDELQALDRRMAAGDPAAKAVAERALGLRPPIPVGTWTRWRKTGEWAVAYPVPIEPGETIRVHARDRGESEQVVVEILWARGGGVIVRVRRPAVEAV